MELALALDEAVKDAGFGSLKLKQEEALEVFVSGEYTFVAQHPTCYGKSMRFCQICMTILEVCSFIVLHYFNLMY